MNAALLVIALLSLASGDAARAEAARRELADVAARIEAMKAAGVRGGREIEALLARSQALALEIERSQRQTAPPPAGADADPQELRERADALRDEVDRLTETLSSVDSRLREEGRRRRAGRLATLEEEGSLFAEASPGRLGGASSGGTPGTSGGTTGASGPQGPQGPGPSTGGPSTPPPSAPADPSTGGAVSGGAALWSVQQERRGWEAQLAPARGDREPELRRKRDAIVAAIEEARRRIDHIEAEARELDARP